MNLKHIILFSALMFLSSNSDAQTQNAQFDAFINQLKHFPESQQALDNVDTILDLDLTPQQKATLYQKLIITLLHHGKQSEVAQYLELLERTIVDNGLTGFDSQLKLARGHQAVLSSNNELAIQLLEEAVALFELNDEKENLIHAIILLANALKTQGLFEKVLPLIEQAKFLSIEVEDTESLLILVNIEADTYNDMSLPEKALKVLQQNISSIEGNTQEVPGHIRSQMYYSLGGTHQIIGDHERSLSAYRKSYQLDVAEGNRFYSAFVLIRIGRALMALERFKAAQGEFENALEIFKEFDHQRHQGWAISNLAELALKKGDKPLARALSEKALSLIDKVQSRILYQETSTYFVASILPEEPDLAIKVLEPIIVDKFYSGLEEAGLRLMTEAYAAKEDYETALDFHKRLYEVKISQLEQEASSKAIAYQTETEYKAGQFEIEQLKAQRALQSAEQKNFLLIGLSVFVVLLIAFSGFIVVSHQNKKSLKLKAVLLNRSLDLKQQLLADISHELRTPLTVLKLHIESLEHNLVKDPKHSYQILHRRLDTLTTLISDIYELAQADTGSLSLETELLPAQKSMLSIAEDVDAIISRAGLEFKADFDLQPDRFIFVDMTRLTQVFNNLARNSVNYTDTPGKVLLQVTNDKQFLICSVDDSSPGVDDESMTKLFDRLYRCDKSRSRDLGGSGLGLSICQKLVELHKGEISISHSLLGGIRVEVKIPLAKVTDLKD